VGKLTPDMASPNRKVPRREKCFFSFFVMGCVGSRFNNRKTKEVSSLITTFARDGFVVRE
jgi:hypothetical protein